MKKQVVYRWFLMASLPVLLASCFAAKEYERPGEIIDETYFRTDAIAQDSTTLAEISWKELFSDPLLQQHIEEGLANNIDIRKAIQQILASEAYFKQGKAGYFPTVNATAQYTHQELSANSQFGGFFSALDQYEVSASLSWEADIWGRIRSQKRAFQADYLQTIEAHKAVKTELVARIARSYYQLLALDKQLAITERTIATRKQSLETTEALKQAGNVTEVGVKQTEAQLYTAEALRVDLINEIRLLENSISILLGRSPDAIARTKLNVQDVTTELKTGVPAQLLRNRPDVRASEFALVEAFELTNEARANFYPSLTVTGTGGFQSLELEELFDTNSLFATVIAGLTQPIFNRRRIRTQYEVSQAQQEQAKLDFKQAMLTASREVSDALYNYEAATEKLDFKQKEYEAYDLATAYSEELLNSGFANYLEVLRARENALNSSLDVVNTRLNQLQAVVNLYEALGGGWQ